MKRCQLENSVLFRVGKNIQKEGREKKTWLSTKKHFLGLIEPMVYIDPIKINYSCWYIYKHPMDPMGKE